MEIIQQCQDLTLKQFTSAATLCLSFQTRRQKAKTQSFDFVLMEQNKNVKVMWFAIVV